MLDGFEMRCSTDVVEVEAVLVVDVVVVQMSPGHAQSVDVETKILKQYCNDWVSALN